MKAFQTSQNSSIAFEIAKLEKQRQKKQEKQEQWQEQKQKNAQAEKQQKEQAPNKTTVINAEADWIKELASKSFNMMRDKCFTVFVSDSGSAPSPALDANSSVPLALSGAHAQDLALPAQYNNTQLKHREYNQQRKQNQHSAFYAFVTLSMNTTNLKNLIEEMTRYKGIVVIRGLKDHSMLETVKHLQSLLKSQNEGVIIDPTLFRKYAIDKVPSFVLSKTCDSSSCVESYDILKGNVTPKFALSQIAKSGDLTQEARELIR